MTPTQGDTQDIKLFFSHLPSPPRRKHFLVLTVVYLTIRGDAVHLWLQGLTLACPLAYSYNLLTLLIGRVNLNLRTTT